MAKHSIVQEFFGPPLKQQGALGGEIFVLINEQEQERHPGQGLEAAVNW
jgi:hypothetical protein